MVDLHTDALSFSSDSYSFPPSTNLENFWKRKLSGLKTPKTYKYTPQPTPLFHPSSKKHPQNKISNPETWWGFLVNLHLKCSVKGQIYRFQEWGRILHASFLLCSGGYVLLTCEDSKMLSCNRAHWETLPTAMEPWTEWMQSTPYTTVDAKHKLGINHFSSKAVFHF